MVHNMQHNFLFRMTPHPFGTFPEIHPIWSPIDWTDKYPWWTNVWWINNSMDRCLLDDYPSRTSIWYLIDPAHHLIDWSDKCPLWINVLGINDPMDRWPLTSMCRKNKTTSLLSRIRTTAMRVILAMCFILEPTLLTGRSCRFLAVVANQNSWCT